MKIRTSQNPPQHPYRRWLLNTIIFLAGALPLAANVGAPPLSFQGKALSIGFVQQVMLPTTDVAAELAVDEKAGKQQPRRFAVPRPVILTTTNSGTWEQLPEGRLWRLRVVSPNATDLNFGFSQFWLPEGATLYVVAESESFFQGPYTSRNNQRDGQLWTAVVPGQAAFVELFVPTQAEQEPRLVLSQVGTGYRDFCHKWKDLGTPKNEGACNNDVICPVGDPWRDEIRSVGVYSIQGSFACTGTLIMDAPGDFRPFFLTANHCELDAANAGTVVVYWNYQSPTCGTHGPGSLLQNQSGATFRAAKYDVDFALIELNQTPSPSFNVYYSGWDRSGTPPGGCVGIHHPDTDVKAISFCTVPLTTINSCIGTGGINTHWFVSWSSGVTEPGSSGSGIWDSASHLLVGTLSGGASYCGAAQTDLWDCYGKFSVAWASGSSSSSRLSDWLDPQSTGVTSIPGANPALVPVVIDAGSSLTAEGCQPGNGAADPNEQVTFDFSLQNIGTAPTTNLVATLVAGNGVSSPSGPQNYGAIAAGGGTAARPFTFTATNSCGAFINPTLQLQDGPTSYGTVTFSLRLGAPLIAISENFDGVTAPALPSGWSSSPAGVWVTTTNQWDTPTNSAFAPDVGITTDYQLTSPSIGIDSANGELTFRHWYATEPLYDGGVLEISINGGAFADILAAGGSFLGGGYNDTISPLYGNPLAGRSAWTGNSGGFVTTTVALPAAAAGGNIQLRWRLGNDSSFGATGWYVDTVTAIDSYNCCSGAPRPTITDMRYNPKRWFQFIVNGTTGSSCAVLVSTNPQAPMSNWVPLTTNKAPFMFIDFNWPVLQPHFFRVRAE